MFGLGAGELIVIFLVVFLLFGPKALPEIARALGEAIKLFKRETENFKDKVDEGSKPSDTDVPTEKKASDA